MRHGVSRVHDEVHDHLLDLRRVGQHSTEVGGEKRDELHVLADQASQHHVHVRDDRVQVEHARLQHLSAAEREKLAGERCGARGGLADLVGMA